MKQRSSMLILRVKMEAINCAMLKVTAVYRIDFDNEKVLKRYCSFSLSCRAM